MDPVDERRGRDEIHHDQPGQVARHELVGAHCDDGAENRRDQDPARKLKAVGARRRDPRHGREDDVRPGDEAAGEAKQRRTEEAGSAQEVHEGTSRDGL